MTLTVAGSPTGGTGAGILDNLYGYASVDGSANTATGNVDNVSDEGWVIGVSRLKDGELTVFGQNREVDVQTCSTVWVNGTTWGIGKNPNNTYYHSGELVAAMIFDEGLSNAEVFELRLLMEAVFNDTISFPPSVVLQGNSLTGQASGGGTTVAAKLMAKTGWNQLRHEVFATGGAKQTVKVEQEYFHEVRRWVGGHSSKRLYWLWSGINDITAGVGSAAIIESLERSLLAARDDGFFTVILPLTPVADNGDGTTYTYSAGQQTILSEVNTWIETIGARIADQFLDIRKIGRLILNFWIHLILRFTFRGMVSITTTTEGIISPSMLSGILLSLPRLTG